MIGNGLSFNMSFQERKTGSQEMRLNGILIGPTRCQQFAGGMFNYDLIMKSRGVRGTRGGGEGILIEQGLIKRRPVARLKMNYV